MCPVRCVTYVSGRSRAGVMRESGMAVLVIKGLSSEWGKMDWEWVLAELNEAVRMELGQRRE